MKSEKTILGIAVVLFLGACATTSRPAPEAASREAPSPEAWGALLNTADYLANAGRHAAVDSTLQAFALRHPGTRAAEEVLFWRALYKLDPRSSAATRAEGRQLMDAYAASPRTSWYRGQANVLRHLAGELSAAEDASGDSAVVPSDTSLTGVAARDRVIQTQRAEIARLNAELERIKRRLAAPTP